MKKILLVDDHKIFTDGIQFLIENTTDLNVVGVLHTGSSVIPFLERNLPDIVLLDINLPDINGFDVAAKIKKEYPFIKILVLSMLDDVSSIEKMLNLGVDGFCLKSGSWNEVSSAIQALRNGGSYLPQNYLRRLIGKHDKISESRLTSRETEIIILICEGKTSADIASKLYLSTRTIETHRRNIYQKLDVHNNVELINYARKHLII